MDLQKLAEALAELDIACEVCACESDAECLDADCITKILEWLA